MKILYKNHHCHYLPMKLVCLKVMSKNARSFSWYQYQLTKCSGITPALRMIKKARELDLQVMVVA
jgi:L-alanine-DL-glutamate epimerase-like enolase superfamily enzyme